MYEPRVKPLLPRRQFYARLARSFRFATTILAVSLGIGVVGYRGFEGLSWIDAFVNAAMILSGMGPVTPVQTFGGKLFAGLYALFSGLVFITCLAMAFAPVVHRFLHKFHVDPDAKSEKEP
jgi:hypothetical protein